MDLLKTQLCQAPAHCCAVALKTLWCLLLACVLQPRLLGSLREQFLPFAGCCAVADQAAAQLPDMQLEEQGAGKFRVNCQSPRW